MKQALLIIDVQRGLFDNAPRPDDADAVIGRINELTTQARAKGVSVIFIQHETKTELLCYGSAPWQLERNLIVTDTDHFVRKTTPDSFLRTDLDTQLKTCGIEQVIICGYASEFCVDTTTRRAAALGYQVILAADAHTTHDAAHATAKQIRAHHNATLPNITSFGPTIIARPCHEITFTA